jgi:oligopeptide transport system permease protein
MFWISSILIEFIIFVALFPGVFTQVPPNDQCFLTADPAHSNPYASSNGGPAPGSPLGFTKQGCDIFSRIVHGASTSLSVGIISTLIVAVIGILFGGFAGFFGGWIDSLLMRLSDIFFAIPYILAAVVVMSVFSANRTVFVISLAIGIFAWPSTARILRSEVLRIKQSDYVMASTAIGLSRLRTLARHVLPNSVAPVIVVTTISLAASITAEATLSFLGVGLPSPIQSWGNDISAGQNDLRTNPTTLIYPSIALSITVLAFIMLGETLREALDPRARALR